MLRMVFKPMPIIFGIYAAMAIPIKLFDTFSIWVQLMHETPDWMVWVAHSSGPCAKSMMNVAVKVSDFFASCASGACGAVPDDPEILGAATKGAFVAGEAAADAASSVEDKIKEEEEAAAELSLQVQDGASAVL